ncbi:peptide chain release factor N(5)-glutamine methyltransferase [Catonella massiliensis]|uniref:Release factor glutamine methyltransferase n=1 Tax=Catonella massiliensis TaxID=2799636 RepID=A0ABS1J125_9FIRM|nr:peptide chain release factor N(5)-glutamine methyltransferase [Catonella massiliensis]MBK5897832.1 peptide chain release factor N(5)-glutamine methyltransferase [Catonella massiliensis]
MDKVEYSLKGLLADGSKMLTQAGIDEAELDARYILEYITGLNSAQYFIHSEDIIEKNKAEEFFRLIERRSKRIPLSYVIGTRDFFGLTFKVDENVLIPEQETELLVEEVIKYSEGKSVLDMCTGSGCIAISIALFGKPSKVAASDISEKALEVARENAKSLKSGEISFIQGDMFENVTDKFDIIVSNPPYIETGEIDELMPEVRDYIPRLALDGDIDGLKFYRIISKEAVKKLNKNGRIFYEIGYNQSRAVASILLENGFTDVKIMKDYSGLDRIVMAKLDEKL